MPLSQIVSASIEDGAVAPVDLSSVAQYTGLKNRIINGQMWFDQRNGGASGTATNVYTVDRWQFSGTQSSKGTWQQNAGSVTPPTGQTSYLGFTSSSAYSVLSTDTFLFQQGIEGINCSDFGWGTANAATVTLSFWVRSSLTGTFGGALINGSFALNYLFNYTINAANTWEQKTVTIPGPTTGTWAVNNTSGIFLRFGLGSGSTFSGTANTWQATGNLVQPTGTVSVVGTNGATWYATGVQLEKGSTATSFDFRDYGRELYMCQRYYQIVGQVVTTTSFYSTVSYLQQMRTFPSIGPVTFDAGTGATFLNMNVSNPASQTKAYQNTNHSQIAQANIPLSAEL